jgi:hypothetical protein
LSLDLALVGTPSIFKYDIEYTQRERDSIKVTPLVKRRLTTLYLLTVVAPVLMSSILAKSWYTSTFQPRDNKLLCPLAEEV